MTHFSLSRQSPGRDITKFFVHNSAGDIIGSASVPNESADDFAKYWIDDRPKAQAAALSPSAGTQHPNPMVNAMLASASRHKFTREAILRG